MLTCCPANMGRRMRACIGAVLPPWCPEPAHCGCLRRTVATCCMREQLGCLFWPRALSSPLPPLLEAYTFPQPSLATCCVVPVLAAARAVQPAAAAAGGVHIPAARPHARARLPRAAPLPRAASLPCAPCRRAQGASSNPYVLSGFLMCKCLLTLVHGLLGSHGLPIPHLCLMWLTDSCFYIFL